MDLFLGWLRWEFASRILAVEAAVRAGQPAPDLGLDDDIDDLDDENAPAHNTRGAGAPVAPVMRHASSASAADRLDAADNVPVVSAAVAAAAAAAAADPEDEFHAAGFRYPLIVMPTFHVQMHGQKKGDASGAGEVNAHFGQSAPPISLAVRARLLEIGQAHSHLAHAFATVLCMRAGPRGHVNLGATMTVSSSVDGRPRTALLSDAFAERVRFDGLLKTVRFLFCTCVNVHPLAVARCLVGY